MTKKCENIYGSTKVKNICFWTKFNKTGHGLAGQDKEEVVTSARTVSLKGVPINLTFSLTNLEMKHVFANRLMS